MDKNDSEKWKVNKDILRGINEMTKIRREPWINCKLTEYL